MREALNSGRYKDKLRVVKNHVKKDTGRSCASLTEAAAQGLYKWPKPVARTCQKTNFCRNPAGSQQGTQRCQGCDAVKGSKCWGKHAYADGKKLQPTGTRCQDCARAHRRERAQGVDVD